MLQHLRERSNRPWIAFVIWFVSPAISFAQSKSQATCRFRSGFRVNLHHFLVQQALEPENHRAASSIPVVPGKDGAWGSALGHYAKAFDGKDLLQRDMEAIKNALSDSGNDPLLREPNLDAEFVEILEAAAPTYRARWRKRNAASNRVRGYTDLSLSRPSTTKF